MDGEKRSAPRKSLEYPAGLETGDGAPLRPCMLSDISRKGARVRMAEPVADMPAFVTLVLSRSGVFRRCRVAWSEGTDMGLEFIEEKRRTRPGPRRAD